MYPGSCPAYGNKATPDTCLHHERLGPTIRFHEITELQHRLNIKEKAAGVLLVSTRMIKLLPRHLVGEFYGSCGRNPIRQERLACRKRGKGRGGRKDEEMQQREIK